MGYEEEAASLNRTLQFGAAKLSPKKIEEYSERLTRLEITIEQLHFKQKRAAIAKEALEKFSKKLDDVPTTWHGMDLEDQQRFIRLVTEKIVLSKPAPNWLQLDIIWLWQNEFSEENARSRCYVWQRRGQSETWTDEENMLLRQLYPSTDRATVLSALPSRNWTAIANQAHMLEIARSYQWNNTTLHKTISMDDAAFMAQVGIEYSPGVRFWWKFTEESHVSLSKPDS